MLETIYQIVCFIYIISGLMIAHQVEGGYMNKKYLTYWAYSAVAILFYIYFSSFDFIGTEYT